jgi:hypothetical protein
MIRWGLIGRDDELQECARAAGADYQQLKSTVVLQLDIAELIAPRMEHVVTFDPCLSALAQISTM